MLPPGHIAAGFLTAKALLHFSHPALSVADQTKLLWWGMFFGFAPDLDSFVAFARVKALVITNKQNVNHRKFYSHAPVLWLVVGLLVYFLASSVYWKYVGLLLWLASWSHFLLDTIQYGIMWLWPLNSKIYAFKDRERDFTITEQSFFGHWWAFVKLYSQTISFYLEALIIIAALIIYFK